MAYSRFYRADELIGGRIRKVPVDCKTLPDSTPDTSLPKADIKADAPVIPDADVPVADAPVADDAPKKKPSKKAPKADDTKIDE